MVGSNRDWQCFYGMSLYSKKGSKQIMAPATCGFLVKTIQGPQKFHCYTRDARKARSNHFLKESNALNPGQMRKQSQSNVKCFIIENVATCFENRLAQGFWLEMGREDLIRW